MGMTRKEYEEKLRELIFYFVAAPAIILIGMAITGSIIDTFLHTPAGESVTFAKIFTFIRRYSKYCTLLSQIMERIYSKS